MNKNSFLKIGIILIGIIGLSLATCSESEPNKDNEEKPSTLPSGMYVAGYDSSQNSTTIWIWNNGKKQNIYTGGTVRPYSISVSGSDVYVAGVEIYDSLGISVATLWENGNKINLSNIGSRAYSVYSTGADVYVAGQENGKAVLWKNSSKTNLDINLNNGVYSRAYYVYSNGSDVYVAGEDDNKAVLWKNGIKSILGGNKSAAAYHLYVSGSDVYVAGIDDTDGQMAVLWENGNIINTFQIDGALDRFDQNKGFINASGYNLYAITHEYPGDHPVLWENGIKTGLSHSHAIFGSDALVDSIYVNGSDVYVAGLEYVYSDAGFEYISAAIWKNGVRTILRRGIGSGYNRGYIYCFATAITFENDNNNNGDNDPNKQTGAAVSAPQLSSKAQNSISITASSFTFSNPGSQTIEYGRNTINAAPVNWQDNTTFIGLKPNTTYYIFARSKANSAYNAGTPSASLSVTTDSDKEAGALVSSPTLSTKGSSSISINAVTAPDNGQSVEYARNTLDTAPSSGWQTGLTFSGLYPNTQYYIFARAKENETYSAGTPSASLSVTTDPPPQRPGIPNITSVEANTASSIRITWETVSGAAGYRISRCAVSNGDSIPWNAIWTQVGTVDSSATMYTNNNLLGYMDYYYRIVAYNEAGEGEYVQTVGKTTRNFYAALIVGKWFPSTVTPGSANAAGQLIFNSNGTLSSGYPTVTSFTYNLVGDIIQLGYGGSVVAEANIIITNNVMTFSNLNGTAAPSHLGSSPYNRQ